MASKIEIEKYLGLEAEDRVTIRVIENPLSLKQLCFVQCSLEPLAPRDDPILNDLMNKVVEMLFDESKFKEAGSDFFVKLEAIVNCLFEDK